MKTVTFSVLSVVLHRGQVWRGLIYNSLQRRHTDRHLPQHCDSVPSDNLPPTARCHYFLHIGPFQGRKTRFDSPRVWAKSSNRPGPNWNPEVFGDGSRVWDQRWDRHWDSAGGRSYSGPRAKDEGLEIFSKVLKWWRNTAVFLTLAGNENIHTSYFLSGRVYRRSTRLLLLSWMHSAAFIQRGIKCQKQTLPCKLIKNLSKSLGWLWRGGVFCSITSVLQMWISCW